MSFLFASCVMVKTQLLYLERGSASIFKVLFCVVHFLPVIPGVSPYEVCHDVMSIEQTATLFEVLNRKNLKLVFCLIYLLKSK